MTNTSSNTETFVVEKCILSYPHLFQPQQVQGTGDPKYSASLLVNGDVATLVWQKAQELAQSHFKKGEFNLPSFQWPLVAANTKPNYAGNPRLAALYLINAKASADYPPQVVDQNRQPVMDRGAVYAGCEVAAAIRLYTYNNMGNIGVGVGLSAVMKTGEGESLGGDSVDPNALFQGVQAQAPAAAPMGGAPQGFPGSAPQGFPGGAPQGFPGSAPQGFPGGAPQGFPGGAPAPQQTAQNFGQPTAPASQGMPAAPFGGAPGFPGQ